MNDTLRVHSTDDILSVWTPRILSILRIVAAAMMTLHGTSKLFGFPSAGALPEHLFSVSGLLGVLEFFGGALVLLGLFTRPAALGLSALMAVDYLWYFTREGWFPWPNIGEYVILYSLVFLYIAFAGPGPWSLDALRSQRR